MSNFKWDSIIRNWKLEIRNLIFYSLILLLPIQLGKHFWPDFSLVLGIRIDYLSPTLFGTDILILLLFLFWMVDLLRQKTSLQSFSLLLFVSKEWKTISLFAFLLIGVSIAKSPILGIYGIIKLLEFMFLGFFTARFISTKQHLRTLITCLCIGVCFESILAISQFLNQGSIGGILYFFGERMFTGDTPGIANASLSGNLVLRPYATFSHPNVLAGYLLVSMTLLISHLPLVTKSKIASLLKAKKIFFILVLNLGTIALILTMSRIAILLWFCVVFLFYLKSVWNIQKQVRSVLIGIALVYAIIQILLLSPLHVRFTNIGLFDESIVLREQLLSASYNMIVQNPLFGVGIHNFLVNLPLFYQNHTTVFFLQPVHNLFALIAAETGFVGLVFFLWFLLRTFKNFKFQISNFKFQILLIALILGMFDHYFLTIQQGQLLFALILGLCWSRLVDSNSNKSGIQ